MNEIADALFGWLEDVATWFAGQGQLELLLISVVVIGICLLIAIGAITYNKTAAQVALADYGGRKSGVRLSSFVCKTCLHRSYAQAHIRASYCVKCAQSEPVKLRVWSPDRQPPGELPSGEVSPVSSSGLSSLH